MAPPPFMAEVHGLDVDRLLLDWRWLVPRSETPLFLTRLGDWVFGARDGSLWQLSSLEGDYRQLARTGAEYNALKRSPEWFEENFSSSWYDIAVGNGLIPTDHQCIGWSVHPRVGGKFEVANLKVFDVVVYQSVVVQLHRQLSAPPPDTQ